MVSYPKAPFPLNPKKSFCPSSKVPMFFHEEDEFTWNPGLTALLKGRTPRCVPQSVELSARQSSAMGTHILGAFVAGRTRNPCGGLPTVMEKLRAGLADASNVRTHTYVDHAPSLPNQLPVGGIASAGGKAAIFAIRMIQAKPCARASSGV